MSIEFKRTMIERLRIIGPVSAAGAVAESLRRDGYNVWQEWHTSPDQFVYGAEREASEPSRLIGYTIVEGRVLKMEGSP